jgi:hypothetical protein
MNDLFSVTSPIVSATLLLLILLFPGWLPVERAQQQTPTAPAQVRARTRQLKEICGGRGRYVLGSGNSIPNYIPVENYLAMVDEAL